MGKCKMMFFAVLLTSMLFLTGCNRYSDTGNDMKNVEERDYATILLTTDGTGKKKCHFVLGIAQEKRVGEKSMTEEISEWDCDDLKELAKTYSAVKGKDLSLSHLKVILLCVDEKKRGTGNAMVEKQTEKGTVESLLYMLDENEEIAKTCPVLQLSDPDDFLEYIRQENRPVGNYFENLVREMERQGQDITWLKDYLKAMREQTSLETFILRHVDEGWTIDKAQGQCYINPRSGL